MAKVKLHDDGRIEFWCPGCGEEHVIRARQADGRGWEYNGNQDAPTFSPSVLYRTVRMKGGDDELDRILSEYTGDQREQMLSDKRIEWRCHSFVTDGNIQFLGDCTHEMAGQTVALPEYPE
jgi:hypothetical protein